MWFLHNSNILSVPARYGLSPQYKETPDTHLAWNTHQLHGAPDQSHSRHNAASARGQRPWGSRWSYRTSGWAHGNHLHPERRCCSGGLWSSDPSSGSGASDPSDPSWEGLGMQGREMKAGRRRRWWGRWRGLLEGLRNVNLHFSHLENRDRERKMERGKKRAKG